MLNLLGKKEVLKMYKLFDWKNEIKENELNEVVDILNRDGIIIFPTETVYGIGGNAMSDDVIGWLDAEEVFLTLNTDNFYEKYYK